MEALNTVCLEACPPLPQGWPRDPTPPANQAGIARLFEQLHPTEASSNSGSEIFHFPTLHRGNDVCDPDNLEFYERDAETGELHRKRVSTGHRDREQAKAQADRLAADFAEKPPEPDPPGITLRTLFDNYLENRTPQVGERQQKHHHRAAEMFCRYFGWSREAESLNRKDWDDFILDRRSGAIDARGNSVPKDDREPIGPRRVQEDLQALGAVLNWGTQADLLDRNPTAGYPLPKDPNPQRPRVTEERYQAMLEVAPEIDWRFEVALVLANETGHRSKAIRHLKWADVDFSAQTIRWRGEADKSSHEHVTPLTKVAISALKRAQENRAAIGDTGSFRHLKTTPSRSLGIC